MEVVNLGRSGLKVSRLCLGTMIFGSQRDEQESFAIMDAAAELGFNFIDVADVYPVPASVQTAGRSEEIVGRWLKGKRSDFVLATKCVNRMGASPNDAGGGRKHVIEACEASLRRLQAERIDLFYLHHSDLEAPLEETLEALDRLIRDGKVHYIGLSNFEAWQLGVALMHGVDRRLTRITAMQPRYNLLNRPYERDLLPLCREAGIGVVPYNPLGAGMLTGKYRRGEPVPEESRFAQGDYGRMYQGRYWQDAMFDVVEAVVEVGKEEGMTPAQVAVAWLLAQDGVTSAIVGASRPEQLKDSAGALEKRLSGRALERLDEVSRRFR